MRYIELNELLKKRSRWGNRQELWKNKNLKEDFKNHFHKKCWYTEIHFSGHDVNIDHFRPKGEIKQFEGTRYNQTIANEGYHWLKNDPSNYRACCIVSNRKTGSGGKSCFFPLLDDSPLLTRGGSEKEKPILLDPCVKSDVDLLQFIGNKVEGTSLNEIEKKRVDISCKIYNYMHPDIIDKRTKTWQEVVKVIEEFESKDISEKSCLRRLEDLVSQTSEFSACAISAVNSMADDKIKEKLDLEL